MTGARTPDNHPADPNAGRIELRAKRNYSQLAGSF